MKKIILLTIIINLAITATAFALSPYVYEGFPDVPEGSYYHDSVKNMYMKNVIKGYDNGLFGPNDNVTRAQVAVMLDRYDYDVSVRLSQLESGIHKILQDQYGLSYTCPEEVLNCTPGLVSNYGCGDENYVEWVNENCQF